MEEKRFDGKRKVAVDVDDTLFYFYDPFLDFFNRRHGTRFTQEDILFNALEKTLKISEAQAIKEIFDFYSHPSFTRLPPVKGATYAVRELSKTYNLGIVTSRPDSTSYTTN